MTTPRATTGPGRPRRDAGPGGRDRLLAAARVEFGRRGYGATTEQLVGAAGVNAPTLYHHFGSKSGLFLAAADTAYEEVLGELTRAVEAGGPTFADAVDAVLDVSAALLARDRHLSALFLVIAAELPRQPDLARRLRPLLRRFGAFFESVAERAPDELLAGRDRRHLGRALVSVLNGLNGQALLLSRRSDVADLVAQVRALLLPGEPTSPRRR